MSDLLSLSQIFQHSGWAGWLRGRETGHYVRFSKYSLKFLLWLDRVAWKTLHWFPTNKNLLSSTKCVMSLGRPTSKNNTFIFLSAVVRLSASDSDSLHKVLMSSQASTGLRFDHRALWGTFYIGLKWGSWCRHKNRCMEKQKLSFDNQAEIQILKAGDIKGWNRRQAIGCKNQKPRQQTQVKTWGRKQTNRQRVTEKTPT